MALFDAKNFNAEVFQKYMDRIPNVKLNELIRSRAIRQRPDLAAAMSDQTGGNYITTPMTGLISGQAPVNYDGATNISTHSTDTYTHSRVVVGRANGWKERDFSYDITGGEDFMENIAEQISEYWDEIDQATLVSILKGVFSMSDVAGAAFVNSHTYDVTSKTNSENVVGAMDGTTLNTAMQKACGDHKSRFSMAIMHSMVATNLENMKLLTYLKYNDAEGLSRDLAIGTLNGRLVMVDDSMPVQQVEKTAGVYTVTVGGTIVATDKFTVGGVEVTAGSTTASTVASTIATALNADDDFSAVYTAAATSGGSLTVTENSKHYGAGAPAVSTDSAAGTIGVVTTTAAVVNTQYTTYVFGDGAIEFTNCGAKVPYEMDRNPATNGGEDILYSRQRKCFAPYGISFTKSSMSSLSPTNTELEMGVNWELVNNGLTSTAKKYIDGKAIPIAQIISLG